MSNARIKILEKIASGASDWAPSTTPVRPRYPYVTEKKTTPTYASPEHPGAPVTPKDMSTGGIESKLIPTGKFDLKEINRLLGGVARVGRQSATTNRDLTWMKWMPPAAPAEPQPMRPLPVAPEQQMRPLHPLTAR